MSFQLKSSKNTQLVAAFRRIVGHRHVLTASGRMEQYCKGYRSGGGPAIAVVKPKTLLEQWQVLELATASDVIIIMQAANTGLTEGSTPNGTYDRGTVIISTTRMKQIQIIREGRQIISFPGATLFDLERKLKPLNRVPHSVIGSSCIGASIMGGVCNNSGGALVERGPAYTELALYAQINSEGNLELVNHLGINLGNDPETILSRLEAAEYSKNDIINNDAQASDTDYQKRVRDVDAKTPARFNADPRRLHDASGCAGKLAVFAVRLDTFEPSDREAVFYLGTNNPECFTKLRREFLSQFKVLPVSGEYMHKDTYDLSKTYGKDLLILIDKLGTEQLPNFFALKSWLDTLLAKLPFISERFSDRFLQILSRLWPDQLPARMEDFRNRFDHHLIIKSQGDGIEEVKNYLAQQNITQKLGWFECTNREARVATLHRFVAAGAAIRYQKINTSAVEDIIALDIALRRNDKDWFESLPDKVTSGISHKLYYGHFFCHVLHQDYIIKKGFDPQRIKAQLLEILDQRGARYPAEHNVGHLYQASDDQANFYRECDPTNSFNPGIGKMSKKKHYT